MTPPRADVSYSRYTIYYFGPLLRRVDSLRDFALLNVWRDGLGMAGCWFCWGKMGKRSWHLKESLIIDKKLKNG